MAANISIIIPTYNYAHYLPMTVRSVLDQDTPGMSMEIIVIDDGSTDDTRAVAASFGKAIRYIRQENQGVSAARNTGLSLAAGEFLVLLDADDLLTPGMLASQANALRANPHVDIMICLSRLASSDTPDSPLHSVSTWPMVKDNFPIHLCRFTITPIHACMLRRRVAESVGGFDLDLKACEDHDYWLRCIASGFNMALNLEAWVIYRKHPDNMSATVENQRLHAALPERAARMLSQKNFLPDRREDAFIAHAAGCLTAAARGMEKILPERALQLLDMGCLAIKNAARERALNPRRAPGRPEDARTESDRNVLHHCALKAQRHMALFKGLSHTGLHEARAIWSKLYPYWEADADNALQIEYELWRRIYIPQTLADMK